MPLGHHPMASINNFKVLDSAVRPRRGRRHHGITAMEKSLRATPKRHPFLTKTTGSKKIFLGTINFFTASRHV